MYLCLYITIDTHIDTCALCCEHKGSWIGVSNWSGRLYIRVYLRYFSNKRLSIESTNFWI